MRQVTFAIASLLAGMVGPASAQTFIVRQEPVQKPSGYSEVRISKAALAGRSIRIWAAAMIDPDCAASGEMTTTVADTPRHGDLKLSDEPFYAAFPPTNPRAACNSRKVPGRQAFYTAEAGFRGHDRVVLQNATSEGRIRKIIVDIDVR